jgi:sterol desaturase/sphingolipid hydroxylase (fatty acid hydroxylase superfamily)
MIKILYLIIAPIMVGLYFIDPLVLASVVGGCVAAELVGYIVHTILHSDKIHWLARAHMIHHLRIYGPGTNQRPTDGYMNSVQDRTSVGSIGIEWVGPLFIAVGALIGTMFWIGIPILYQAIVVGTAISWGFILFGYMHDVLHRKDFWMSRNWLFRDWYKALCRLHDIHHHDVTKTGLMNKNYGICFFVFDWLAGTYQPQLNKVNQENVATANKRYDFVYD